MIKRCIQLILIALICFTVSGIGAKPTWADETVATGECGAEGDNLTYRLTKDANDVYTLTILGSGEMRDGMSETLKSLFREQSVYSATSPKLVLTEGVTSIGANAFDNINFRGSIVLPGSLASIGFKAFYRCQYFSGQLHLPDNVERIDGYAFNGCSGLGGSVEFPLSLTVIGDYAFSGCNFASYYLPHTIEQLGVLIFNKKYNTSSTTTLYCIRDSYAYTWAQENGYSVEASPARYRLSYDANGGSVEPAWQTIEEERPFGTLAVPTRTGYTFTGWFRPDGEDGETEVNAQDICTGDLTVSAHWTVNAYEVSFDANGGTPEAPDAKSVTFDEAYGTLPEVSREGYTFAGWFLPDTDTPVTAETRNATGSDHTLTARWKGVDVTVSFDAMEGAGTCNPVTVSYGLNYGTLPTVTKENCEFMGWFTKASGGTQITSTSEVKTMEAHTLFARWEGVQVSVSFDKNGATVGQVPAVLYKSFGAAYGALPVVGREDYDFAGWYTEPDANEEEENGTLIEADSLVQNAASHWLYAHWKDKRITITFNTNHGTPADAITIFAHGTYGELPETKRTGYDFVGWYTTYDFRDGTQVNAESVSGSVFGHALYARWTPRTDILVTFDAQGGTPSAENKTVTFASAYGTLPEAEKTGYDFGGWYTAASGGSQVFLNTLVQRENHTLYAHWLGRKIQVALDPQGGSGVPETVTVRFEDTYRGLPIPSFYGYRFEGWFRAPAEAGVPAGEAITEETEVEADLTTLYAHWSANDYEITYLRLFDGVNAAENPATYQRPIEPIMLYPAERKGYRFDGWYTSETYTRGSILKTIPKNLAEDLTLYAKWTIIQNHITYHTGMLGVKNPNAKKTSYFVTDADYPLGQPTKNGYVFLGWYLDENFTESKKVTRIAQGSAGDLHLYAKWRGARYQVNYHGNGAAAGAVAPTEHEYGTSGTPLADGSGFVYQGYHVQAWYLNAKCKGTKYLPGNDKNQLVDADGAEVNLYADWKPNKYYVNYLGNGADRGSGKRIKVTYGRRYKIRSCEFRKKGYVFAGWNTAPDGSGTPYAVGTVSTGLTFEQNETVALYAQWEPISYTIRFASGTGNASGTMEEIKVTYDEAVDLPLNAFDRTDYRFDHWEAAVRVDRVYPVYSDGERCIPNLTTKKNAVVTLRARWNYDFILDPCTDGEDPITICDNSADQKVKLPKKPFVREGYRFLGWALTPGGGVKYSDGASVKNIAGRTLYAVWK